MTRVALCPIKAPCFHNSPSGTSDTSMPGIFVCMEPSFGVCRDVSGRVWKSSGMCALLKKKIQWRQFRYLASEAFFVSLNYL